VTPSKSCQTRRRNAKESAGRYPFLSYYFFEGVDVEKFVLVFEVDRRIKPAANVHIDMDITKREGRPYAFFRENVQTELSEFHNKFVVINFWVPVQNPGTNPFFIISKPTWETSDFQTKGAKYRLKETITNREVVFRSANLEQGEMLMFGGTINYHGAEVDQKDNKVPDDEKERRMVTEVRIALEIAAEARPERLRAFAASPPWAAVIAT
jgi:hypothetical protein